MLPTFLGIGAPRTGTTWLYRNLAQHPDVWLTPLKELHYFDTLHTRFLVTNRDYRNAFRARLRDYWTSFPTHRPKLGSLRWDLRYFLGKRDLSWYSSLFRPRHGQIAGEITPAYCTLPQDTVALVHKLNPELKVIFLMRDPIDRAWSSAVKQLARQHRRPMRTVPEEDVIRVWQRESAILRGDYVRTIDIWERVFGPQQVHIDFLDEIQHNPREMLLRVFRFLNISDRESCIPRHLDTKVNSTDEYKVPIPEELEAFLARRYLPQLEVLHQRFRSHPTTWLQRAADIVRRG